MIEPDLHAAPGSTTKEAMSANTNIRPATSTSDFSPAVTATVIVPAYNAGKTIAETITSVLSVASWPIIVVDDGSSDDTATVAERLGALVVRQENQGASIARATGLKLADSELVIFLDSDDSLLPGALEAAKLLLSNHEVGVVGGLITPNTNSNPQLLQPRRNLPRQISTDFLLAETYAPWPQSAAIWRRSSLLAAQKASPPPLNPLFAEDFELLIRLSLNSRVLSTTEHTCLHRLAGGKSAVNAVAAVRQSERVRSYYSAYLDLDIQTMSDFAIRDQASWRQFRALQAEIGLGRAILDVLRQPAWLLRILRHRGRRAINRIRTDRI